MIQTGKKYGMQLLDDAIMELLNKGWISGEEAYIKANDKGKFRPFLRTPPTDFTDANATDLDSAAARLNGGSMKKQEIDYILARMLDAYNNVSDLNITVGKPFQVESFGPAHRRGDRSAVCRTDTVSN